MSIIKRIKKYFKLKSINNEIKFLELQMRMNESELPTSLSNKYYDLYNDTRKGLLAERKKIQNS